MCIVILWIWWFTRDETLSPLIKGSRKKKAIANKSKSVKVSGDSGKRKEPKDV